MSEKPPVEQPESVEKKETIERPPLYKTIKTEVLEVLPDGSKKELSISCNGKMHRKCIDVVSYDENGEVTFADELSREEDGTCDGNHS